MDNFFSCGKTSNYSRDYSKGKSFKFSEWNEKDTYNNDEFVQDWVKYNGKLYICIKTNTNVPPTSGTDEWLEVLSADNIWRFEWDEFQENVE